MSYLYIAYPASSEGDPSRAKPVGAGASLEHLLCNGIFLRQGEIHIYRCRVLSGNGSSSSSSVKRESFLGTYCATSEVFRPAEPNLAWRQTG
ncbi:hypothetical protein [Thermostichus vulcanus]|uniref:Uncharacterized protein n=1 Tax=Thermostichus vulcanus str. 'Rupite' TaxID=2813851 RepID=A0ABT0C6K2_THEVL|nr:hypothetical protein [Thermostichus vulcanus]MCJ2541332.1 hypothetical protein [Thermostichus vulcanus str. 'Rupite']